MIARVVVVVAIAVAATQILYLNKIRKMIFKMTILTLMLNMRELSIRKKISRIFTIKSRERKIGTKD